MGVKRPVERGPADGVGEADGRVAGRLVVRVDADDQGVVAAERGVVAAKPGAAIGRPSLGRLVGDTHSSQATRRSMCPVSASINLTSRYGRRSARQVS
jgi:hypothetical protein